MEVKNNNELYEKYGDFVKKSVSRILFYDRLWTEADEAEQIAWEAVIKCYKRYTGFNKVGEPVKFETYARHRIRGAIIDDVRKKNAIRTYTKEGGSTYRNKQTSSLDALTEQEYDSLMLRQQEQKTEDVSFEEIISSVAQPEKRNILRMLYVYDLTAQEVSVIFGVTESRISQIRKEVLHSLKQRKEIYNAWQ